MFVKYILINVKQPIKPFKYATTRNVFLHFKLRWFNTFMKYTLIDVKKHLKL